MPKQGGQGKGKPKLSDKNFGSSLIKSQRSGTSKRNSNGSKNLVLSILDNSSLDDYIMSNEMNGTEAEVIRPRSDITLVCSTVLKSVERVSNLPFSYQHLSIPKRPIWSRDMLAEDLNQREVESFLNWRRSLVAAEDNSKNLKLTPFEKNIDVWRQLWRVVERSDILIQIVDARNPLFY
jgi:large subunit GTPase 1